MKEIDIIIGKYLSRDCSEEELAILNQWRENPENEASFQLLTAAWSTGETVTSENKEGDWQAISNALAMNETKTAPKQRYLWPIAMAASLTLIMGIVFMLSNKTGTEQQIVKSFNTTDSNQEFTLPDGSVVTLGRFSTLDLYTFQHSQRHVKLTGQAYFKVTRDEDKPFVVTTACSSTTVLGTQFSVHEKNSTAVTVMVKEGKVALSGKNNEGKVLLTASEQGILLEKKQVLKTQINDPNAFSWQTGILIFDNSTLVEVSRHLERHYGYQFLFEGLREHVRLTGTFKQKTIAEIMDLIAATTETSATKKDNVITFRP